MGTGHTIQVSKYQYYLHFRRVAIVIYTGAIITRRMSVLRTYGGGSKLEPSPFMIVSIFTCKQTTKRSLSLGSSASTESVQKLLSRACYKTEGTSLLDNCFFINESSSFRVQYTSNGIT